MCKIKLIVFDFDGTLCDTQRNIVSTLKATIKKLNLPTKTDEECISIIGLPLNECFRQLFPNLDDITIQKCADTYRKIFAETLANIKPSPFPHVISTIKLLKQHGYILTIASSRSHASLVELTQTMGIYDDFELLLGADDVDKAKPDPYPVLKTLKMTGFTPQQALIVGDMPVDILMGNRAGATTIGVTYGNGSVSILKEAGANHIINSFNEILHLIDS